MNIEHYLTASHFDLVTPDGVVTSLKRISKREVQVKVFIERISPIFVGFQIDKEKVFFNIKSTLAQVGVTGKGVEYQLDKKNLCAEVIVQLIGIDRLGEQMLKYITPGAFIGKLFAADDRRKVKDPYYLTRMFGRSDRWGDPLLSLGGLHGSDDLILDTVDGRVIAYLSLQNGKVTYDESIYGFLPTIGKALKSHFKMRGAVSLHQIWNPLVPRNISKNELLLVKTFPLHIRTVFGRVVNELLSPGYEHTTASILSPDTKESGDIYEFFGDSKREITDVPLEFYTLEPYREYVFFEDRDQLKSQIENPKVFFKAFDHAPKPIEKRVATFIVKGHQLTHLKESDWIERDTKKHVFPGVFHGERQAHLVKKYIKEQPSYPLLSAIDTGVITSQGILLSRYFPSPFMKRMLLTDEVQNKLKGIYFQYPSLSSESFFSSEDRALLHDLFKFGIPVFWVDSDTKSLLQYIEKPDRDTGIFVPKDKVNDFLRSTVFGIYGSNLLSGNFEGELRKLLKGILEMKNHLNHPQMNAETPLSLVTGGGPGAMEVGNKVAKELGILSCANIVDFRFDDKTVVNEQKQNPYVDAKMTYRLDNLVERQSEFNLDFPIFLVGGIGTDFEFSLEEVRRKVGATIPSPIILFGEAKYWKDKITSRFQRNLKSGTIKGSEWLSNCFYCIENAEQGIEVYRKYFSGTLPIGVDGPVYEDGFVVCNNDSK